MFHPDFYKKCPSDISVLIAVHSGVIAHSTFSPGFTALKDEIGKDAWHRRLIKVAGGVFFSTGSG